ncbi:MAG: MmgE/PrpD family protein [Chloroflexi bacterium]|nr:MmgE/PrpD family protein [Chloroflexota bacterium]
MTGDSGPTLLESLGEYAAGVDVDRVPTEVLAMARWCVLDHLGAVLAACAAAEGRTALGLAELLPTAHQATIASGRQAGWADAALINGMLAHALELDDAHSRATGLHPGAVVVPAALAMAERAGTDGATFLAAVIAGYEVAGRIGAAINPQHRYQGFHTTGTVGALGAAAAAGRAMGLRPSQMVHALGIAASQASGIFAFLSDGATVKCLHSGRAAQSGVLSVLLAEAGMTGPAAALEGSDGFFQAYTPTPRPAEIVEGLGKQFSLRDVYFKRHASCGHLASAIDAALAAAPEVPLARVSAIQVMTYRAAAVLDNRAPDSAMAARFSLPFNVAYALRAGPVAPSAFEAASLTDQPTRDLAARVRVREEPAFTSAFPNKRSALVRITWPGGAVERLVDTPKGMPGNPLSEDDIQVKFHSLVNPVLGVVGARALASTVQSVERIATARSITRWYGQLTLDSALRRHRRGGRLHWPTKS